MSLLPGRPLTTKDLDSTAQHSTAQHITAQPTSPRHVYDWSHCGVEAFALGWQTQASALPECAPNNCSLLSHRAHLAASP